MQMKQYPLALRATAVALAMLLVVGSAAGCGKDPASSDVQTSGGDTTASTTAGDGGVSGDESAPTNPDGSVNSDGTGNPGSDENPGDGDTQTSSNGGGSSEGLKVNQTGFPIVSGGKVQISIMLPRVANSPSDLDSIPFTKEFEKMTGVDLKYIVVNEGEQFVKKQTAITSKNMPDIFALYGAVFSSSEMYKYSKEGILAETGSMLKTWAPNIEAALNNVPGARAASTLSNGKIYGLPGITEEAWGQTWTINKKWLDELGLGIPQTIDEFYKALDAFKNQDPNGNGKKDEEAFATWEWNPNMWNPWGLNISWYNKMTVDEKGTVAFAPTTNNYREGIRFWKKCYDNKLVYKRALGTNYTEFTALLAEGKVGCFIWPWPQGVFSEAKLKDYVPFNFPLGNNTGDFKPGVASYENGVQPFRFVISQSCKSKEVALRVLDYLYTPEGHLMKTYGPEGTLYKKIGSKYKMLSSTENVLKYGLGDTIASNSRIRSVMLEKHESEMNYQEKYSVYAQKQWDSMFASRKPKYTIDKIMLNEAEAKRKDELWTALGNAGDWGIQAIMGAKNVETEWNAFVSDCESKGSKELAKIYQDAFNRQK